MTKHNLSRPSRSVENKVWGVFNVHLALRHVLPPTVIMSEKSVLVDLILHCWSEKFSYVLWEMFTAHSCHTNVWAPTFWCHLGGTLALCTGWHKCRWVLRTQMILSDFECIVVEYVGAGEYRVCRWFQVSLSALQENMQVQVRIEYAGDLKWFWVHCRRVYMQVTPDSGGRQLSPPATPASAARLLVWKNLCAHIWTKNSWAKIQSLGTYCEQ